MARSDYPHLVQDDGWVMQHEEYQHQNLQLRLQCKECREAPPNLVEDQTSGDVVCASCGLVLQQHCIDYRRSLSLPTTISSRDDDQSHTEGGIDTLWNAAPLQTTIALESHGSDRKTQLYVVDKDDPVRSDKALLKACGQIGTYCDEWQLPSVVSSAAMCIYDDVHRSLLFKRKSPKSILGGCIFLACRRNGIPRTLREVQGLIKVSRRDIARAIRSLHRITNEKGKAKSHDCTAANARSRFDSVEPDKSTAFTNPADLCPRFCSKLNIDHHTTSVAVAVANKAAEFGTAAGRSPLSSAAACILMARRLTGRDMGVEEIGQVAGVTCNTIRAVYKLLCRESDKLVTEEMLAGGLDPSMLHSRLRALTVPCDKGAPQRTKGGPRGDDPSTV